MPFGKIKLGLRIPAMILAILAVVMRIAYHIIDIYLRTASSFFDTTTASYTINELSNMLILASAVVVIIYCFGICNKRPGKVFLGISMCLMAAALLIWAITDVTEGFFGVYTVTDALDISAAVLFAVWLFVRARSKVIPIISLSLMSLMFLFNASSRIMSLMTFAEDIAYGYMDVEYMLLSVTNMNSWTLLEMTFILLVIAEMTRSKVSPSYSPVVQAPVYAIPFEKAPEEAIPAVQQKETEVMLEVLKMKFETGVISEEEYRHELIKLVSEK